MEEGRQGESAAHVARVIVGQAEWGMIPGRDWLSSPCIESTGRFGMELGYHVTQVKDATAAFSREAIHAAQVNGPTFAFLRRQLNWPGR